jgi:hypothetical protein
MDCCSVQSLRSCRRRYGSRSISIWKPEKQNRHRDRKTKYDQDDKTSIHFRGPGAYVRSEYAMFSSVVTLISAA